MKTLLYTLIGVALISSIGYGTFLNYNDQNDDLQTSAPNPYISFVDSTRLYNDLTSQLHGQTQSDQLKSIKSFVFQQRKFFKADQIMQILNQLDDPDHLYVDGSIRKTVISLIKPYIGPLSTDEVIQMLEMVDQLDGIVSSILINQIYDLQGNKTNIINLSGIVGEMQNNNRDQIVLPQSTKEFYYNFLLTFEGKHVGFLIDQSESMGSIAYTKTDGTTVTRYNMLQEFYMNRYDIFYNFLEFSYLFLGNRPNPVGCEQCSTSSYGQPKGFNADVSNYSQCAGQNDLYLKLSQILNKPYSTISDLYIWSDGMVPQGAQGVSDFIKLIDSLNAQRMNKIRINTVSFLFGGNEDVASRTTATTLLQTLADYTNGTFIQVKPNFN